MNEMKKEKVATLNQTTGATEWEVPTARQEFDNHAEMYQIKTDGGELVVSEKYKVFAGNNKNQINPFSIMVTNFSVVNTLTNDCALRCGSLDQIKALIDKANAKKSASSGSDNAVNAFFIESSYTLDLKNLIFPSTSVCLISNSCPVSLDLSKHSSLCFSNSTLMNSGARKLALRENNKYEDTEFGFIKEKNIFVSNTSFIFYSDNSSFILGDTSESSLLNLPFFAFLPNSTLHLISSCSSEDSNFLRICSNSSNSILFTNSFTTLANAILNSSLNCSGISNLITISDMSYNKYIEYKNLSVKAVKEQTDELVVNPNHKVYAKIIGQDEQFRLMPVTEAYTLSNSGKEIMFLNTEREEVKVSSIEKINNYHDKIYDVDVGNDIVLVRRNKVVCDENEKTNEINVREDENKIDNNERNINENRNDGELIINNENQIINPEKIKERGNERKRRKNE